MRQGPGPYSAAHAERPLGPPETGSNAADAVVQHDILVARSRLHCRHSPSQRAAGAALGATCARSRCVREVRVVTRIEREDIEPQGVAVQVSGLTQRDFNPDKRTVDHLLHRRAPSIPEMPRHR